MTTWSTEHAIETTAAPEDVWALWADVPGWPAWDASLAATTLDGPFAVGTTGTLQPAGMDALPFVLLEVDPGRGFVDETGFAGLVLRFRHAVAPVADAGARIVVRVEAEGPGADEIGPAVAEDLPESLGALAAAAVARRTMA